MKKYLVIVCCLLLAAGWSWAQAPEKKYTLTGELAGVVDGTKIALVPFAKYDVKPEAETTVVGGRFSFSGQVPEPRLYYLVLGNKEAFHRLMIENSSIMVKGEVENHPGQEGEPAMSGFEKMEVTGSKSNDYLYSQLAMRESLDSIYTAINTKFFDIQALWGKARISKNQAMKDSSEALPRYTELMDANKNFFAEVENRYRAVFEANKETFWGPLMMLNLYSYFTPEVKPTFEKMSKQAKESYYGKMVAEDLYPANRTGEKVPDFIALDKNGNKIGLNDLIKDKKVILIDFWASWCAPCRKELPNVKANYEKYAAKGFEVLGFSIDKDPRAWAKALEEEGLKWPNFNDLEVSTLYKVKAVPTTYLIDNQGRLLAENVRGEELGKKLEEILGN